ncbi:MAG: D-glycerate dehydrogenase [Myxococcales bacterium]|nr:D-glycerate dehydrogenase [Myxococcales bacterium]
MMRAMRVFVTRRLPEAAMARLEKASEPSLDLDVWEGDEPPPPDVLHARVRGVDGIVCLLTDAIDEALLAAAGDTLRVVSQMAVGVDNIDLAACAARGVAVGHTPGVLSESTADLTLALMLATCRRVVEAAEDVRAGRWRSWSPLGWAGVDLYGATVGIVGLGRIGQAVARRLAGFNVTLLYSSRRALTKIGTLAVERVPLDELFERADIVSLHVPLTDETRGLVGEAALARMKRTAILINTARGEIVDQAALLAALDKGHIAAAGLDVTTPEPLPADHPLLARRDVVVLPHIGSASRRTRQRMADIAVDNLLAGLRGAPMQSPPPPATPEQG